MGQDRSTPRDKASEDATDNKAQQGTDKAPGEERGKEHQVTQKDLKGKKVDGDPSREQDKPLSKE